MIDILAPGGVIADVLDIESAIHLVPVIFLRIVGTYHEVLKEDTTAVW